MRLSRLLEEGAKRAAARVPSGQMAPAYEEEVHPPWLTSEMVQAAKDAPILFLEDRERLGIRNRAQTWRLRHKKRL